MVTPGYIEQQINDIILYLVKVGLAGDQNIPIRRDAKGTVEITFPNAVHVSTALKDRSYTEIYQRLAKERAFNAKMPDGALIQMMYLFSDGTIQQHRLAFFPSPHLEEFQNNPDIYLEDQVYAEVIAKNIVPFPIRFDYDARETVHQELTHPKSHLTLGQYERCRIPVSAPLTPSEFVDFILRNFYHTAFQQYADNLPQYSQYFEDSILPAERKVVHVVLPRGA